MHWIFQLMIWSGALMVITSACVIVAYAWAGADTLLGVTLAIILTGIVLVLTPMFLSAITELTREP